MSILYGFVICVLAIGLIVCMGWLLHCLMLTNEEKYYKPTVTILLVIAVLIIAIYLYENSIKIERCEKHLKRTQHCEIVIKAVEV